MGRAQGKGLPPLPLLQDLEEEIQKNSQILADNQNLNAQLKIKDSEIVQVGVPMCACAWHVCACR